MSAIPSSSTTKKASWSSGMVVGTEQRKPPQSVSTLRVTDGLTPVSIFYVQCLENSCWVLFDTPRPVSPICPAHGHQLNIHNIKRGAVTPLEAKQGWTRQKPN